MAISNRGFASMNKDKHCEIASMGGKATNGKNLTYEGRVKGGKISKRGSRKKANEQKER